MTTRPSAPSVWAICRAPGRGGAAGGAGEDRLVPGEVQRRPVGRLVVDGDDAVDVVPPDGRGHEVLADAVDEVLVDLLGRRQLAVLEVVLVDAAHRIDADDLHLRILLLEVLGGAADGAAGADAGHPVGDLAVRLPPDLGTRGTVVGLGVGLVVILIGEVGPLLVADALGDLVIRAGIVRLDVRRAE